ncbi:metalloregulator ArsR/SmtB family transcription factor [Rhodanobacter sp. C03]|uniref:ArsR/SmtB family transcription factor n=1 Tax=Rhodanobacter sp. C03 TaxID=1945858 RepID=UPI0009858039|nr:metalloregulator ArsR/SmtB family transcription factor [Rhodanobacter sp. C03]OOG60169.1 transcriptional regulator [Rhodanobacter sp. C03]
MANTDDPLSITFAALADPTRRAILARLTRGEATVGELGEPFDMSAPAISKHLRVLEGAGLIAREVDARWRICRLRAKPMHDAHDWLEAYRRHWEGNLDRLVEFVERTHRAEARKTARGAPRAPRKKP